MQQHLDTKNQSIFEPFSIEKKEIACLKLRDDNNVRNVESSRWAGNYEQKLEDDWKIVPIEVVSASDNRQQAPETLSCDKAQVRQSALKQSSPKRNNLLIQVLLNAKN